MWRVYMSACDSLCSLLCALQLHSSCLSCTSGSHGLVSPPEMSAHPHTFTWSLHVRPLDVVWVRNHLSHPGLSKVPLLGPPAFPHHRPCHPLSLIRKLITQFLPVDISVSSSRQKHPDSSSVYSRAWYDAWCIVFHTCL
jgi:hypothetical protein